MNKPALLKIACILFVFCAATAIASPAQVFTNALQFSGTAGRRRLILDAGLVHASDGNFYGTTFGGGDQPGTPISASAPTAAARSSEITPAGTATLALQLLLATQLQRRR